MRAAYSRMSWGEFGNRTHYLASGSQIVTRHQLSRCNLMYHCVMFVSQIIIAIRNKTIDENPE